jgi:hypothetical protein
MSLLNCNQKLQPDFVTKLGTVNMSQKEFQRVKVIENAGERLNVREASRLPQLSELQRLKSCYRTDSVG